MKRAATLAVVLTATLMYGCNSDSTTNAAPNAEVTVTASPNPAAHGASSDAAYQRGTSVNLTLSESAGVGALVTAVTSRVESSAGGIVIVGGEATTFRSQVRASGNRLEARGTLNVTIDFLYTLPSGVQEALITVSFAFFDDNGYQFTQTMQVQVK